MESSCSEKIKFLGPKHIRRHLHSLHRSNRLLHVCKPTLSVGVQPIDQGKTGERSYESIEQTLVVDTCNACECFVDKMKLVDLDVDIGREAGDHNTKAPYGTEPSRRSYISRMMAPPWTRTRQFTARPSARTRTNDPNDSSTNELFGCSVALFSDGSVILALDTTRSTIGAAQHGRRKAPLTGLVYRAPACFVPCGTSAP